MSSKDKQPEQQGQAQEQQPPQVVVGSTEMMPVQATLTPPRIEVQQGPQQEEHKHAAEHYPWPSIEVSSVKYEITYPREETLWGKVKSAVGKAFRVAKEVYGHLQREWRIEHGGPTTEEEAIQIGLRRLYRSGCFIANIPGSSDYVLIGCRGPGGVIQYSVVPRRQPNIAESLAVASRMMESIHPSTLMSQLTRHAPRKLDAERRTAFIQTIATNYMSTMRETLPEFIRAASEAAQPHVYTVTVGGGYYTAPPVTSRPSGPSIMVYPYVPPRPVTYVQPVYYAPPPQYQYYSYSRPILVLQPFNVVRYLYTPPRPVQNQYRYGWW